MSTTIFEPTETEMKLLVDKTKWQSEKVKGKRKRRQSANGDCSEGASCVFCCRRVDERLGTLLKVAKYPEFFAVHDLCLVLASGLVAETSEDVEETALTAYLQGFTLDKIQAEFRRGRLLRCIFCGKRGATLNCQAKGCRKGYHAPCAFDDHAFFEFNGYSMSCKTHKPTVAELRRQVFAITRRPSCKLDLSKIPPSTPSFRGTFQLRVPRIVQDVVDKRETEEEEECLLCANGSCPRQLVMNQIVQTSCCQDHFMHFRCVQIRCPLCGLANDVTNYIAVIRAQGIYVPASDAIYDENMDARESCWLGVNCKCPNGSYYSEESTSNRYQSWEWLNVCEDCGSHIHRECAGEPWTSFDPHSDETGEEEKWSCGERRESGVGAVHEAADGTHDTSQTTRIQSYVEEISSDCESVVVLDPCSSDSGDSVIEIGDARIGKPGLKKRRRDRRSTGRRIPLIGVENAPSSKRRRSTPRKIVGNQETMKQTCSEYVDDSPGENRKHGGDIRVFFRAR